MDWGNAWIYSRFWIVGMIPFVVIWWFTFDTTAGIVELALLAPSKLAFLFSWHTLWSGGHANIKCFTLLWVIKFKSIILIPKFGSVLGHVVYVEVTRSRFILWIYPFLSSFVLLRPFPSLFLVLFALYFPPNCGLFRRCWRNEDYECRCGS